MIVYVVESRYGTLFTEQVNYHEVARMRREGIEVTIRLATPEECEMLEDDGRRHIWYRRIRDFLIGVLLAALVIWFITSHTT